MAAIAPKMPKIRTARSFIGLSFRAFLEALVSEKGFHARSSFCGLCARRHKNRPDTMVGRLHYSLSLTLSAHFR
jgi:hypothetical protein